MRHISLLNIVSIASYSGGNLFMNEIKNKENEKIENMIYEIRGMQVMLDSDLATLYQCKNGTKSINLAVKRNLIKFPEVIFN